MTKHGKIYHSLVKHLTKKELKNLSGHASTIPDKKTSELAKWSLKTKAFHSWGAAIFSVPLPNKRKEKAIEGLVAFETIADFLDTLSDRTKKLKEEDYANMHNIMINTLNLKETRNFSPFHHTERYFQVLVQKSQDFISKLPSYNVVKPHLATAVKNYATMQTLTHLPLGEREKRCQLWFSQHTQWEPAITWWEFTAAGGSTLTMFSLLHAAHRPNLKEELASEVFHAYFPWINGINILLDSFIDQDEDALSGDMNFMNFYQNHDDHVEGILKFIKTAQKKVQKLPHPDFHHFIIKEMVNLYARKALRKKALHKNAKLLLRSV